ncbi:NRDE family protein [Fibrella aquatica]|uniref:NRDE family protein n=1 Tax=Fibrella aquatica TaxID=3242487 RepID=UPI00351FF172
MCTATYFPLTDNGFILTHSRDERVLRPSALQPKTYRINEQDITFPKDPLGQGTWIAATASVSVCLLNGAFTAHVPTPPYKHSRGLVIPHFFAYSSIDHFSDTYDFEGIEPFTLLIATVGRLVELRWNGSRLFMHDKDPDRPHIWSSLTLYSPIIIAQREDWFRDWQHQHPNPTVDSIRWFHQNAGDGDSTNSVRMNRNNELLTLSLSSIVHQEAQVEFIYKDFTQQSLTHTLIRPSYATA